jgi:hypothetical protein
MLNQQILFLFSDSEDTNSFRCEFCDFSAKTRKSLKAHVDQNHQELPEQGENLKRRFLKMTFSWNLRRFYDVCIDLNDVCLK